jgi:peptidoglycan/LPS O-acetylase OafA/YrhL
MFIGSVVAYIAFRQGGYPPLLLDWTLNSLGSVFVSKQLAWSQHFLSSYVIGVLVAIHFVGAASVSIHLEKLLNSCEKYIRYLANYTFAIYLFHYPCLQFFAAVSASITDQRVRTTIVIGGTILVIWALGTVTERRKDDLKRWLLSAYSAIARKGFLRIKG